MTQEGVYESGDILQLSDGVKLKAELADFDGSGCYVCDNGRDKCYFLNSELPCPKCHSTEFIHTDYVGSRVIFRECNLEKI